MAQARHLGKIVLTQRPLIRRAAFAENGIVRRDGTYLVAGGLGALGRRLAGWLADEGAGAIILTSRSEPAPGVEAALKDLRRRGSRAEVVCGDIAEQADVQKIMAALGELDLPPLRGVVNAAGVLDDGVITEQDQRRFMKVLRPKVAGTLNLHRATAGHDLDFMICFSSIAFLI